MWIRITLPSRWPEGSLSACVSRAAGSHKTFTEFWGKEHSNTASSVCAQPINISDLNTHSHTYTCACECTHTHAFVLSSKQSRFIDVTGIDLQNLHSLNLCYLKDCCHLLILRHQCGGTTLQKCHFWGEGEPLLQWQFNYEISFWGIKNHLFLTAFRQGLKTSTLFDIWVRLFWSLLSLSLK